MIAQLRLPRGWTLGSRSGFPYAPVLGSIDRGPYAGNSHLVSGERSENLPLFHQLDMRAERTWTLDRIVISAYLDLQNVYNRANTEAYIYIYDWRD